MAPAMTPLPGTAIAHAFQATSRQSATGVSPATMGSVPDALFLAARRL
jgi:hypothetical protein